MVDFEWGLAISMTLESEKTTEKESETCDIIGERLNGSHSLDANILNTGREYGFLGLLVISYKYMLIS